MAPPPRNRKPGELDPELSMALHPKLRDPLRTLMALDGWTGSAVEPEMIQAMYFWQGSTQERHQDAFYLPECTSMWMPLEDVSPRNGMPRLSPRAFLQNAVPLTRSAARDRYPRGAARLSQAAFSARLGV